MRCLPCPPVSLNHVILSGAIIAFYSVGINLLMALDANHTLDHFEIAQGNYYEKAELEQIEMALARNRAQKLTESTVSAVAALSGARACAAASVMCVWGEEEEMVSPLVFRPLAVAGCHHSHV